MRFDFETGNVIKLDQKEFEENCKNLHISDYTDQFPNVDWTEEEIEKLHIGPYPIYLNVYEVGTAYGGHEEGGWWFDVGEPLESICCHTWDDCVTQAKRLGDRYKIDPDDRERIRGKGSMAGGYDIEIHIETHYGQAYPREKPRYE